MSAHRGTATLIRTLSRGKGEMALYRVSPPLRDYDDATFDYVVASAAMAWGEPETYIFPSDERGEIVAWGEMPGSQKGTLQHSVVFGDLGYDIVREVKS